MVIRDAELHDGSRVRGRPVPLVRCPPVSGIVEVLHEAIARDLREDRSRRYGRAGRVGFDLHVDGKLTAERILGATERAEEIIRSRQPVVGSVQENATGDEAAAGDVGEGPATREPQRRDNAPLIDLSRRRVTDGRAERPRAYGLNKRLSPTRRQRLGIGEPFGDGLRFDTHQSHANCDGAGESPAAHLIHPCDNSPPPGEGHLKISRSGRHEAAGTAAKTSWCAMSVVQRAEGQMTAWTVPTTEETGTKGDCPAPIW